MFWQQPPLASLEIMNEQFRCTIVFLKVFRSKKTPKHNSLMLGYTKPTRIAYERFKGPLFCACTYMFCSYCNRARNMHNTTIQSSYGTFTKNVHYNGSASELQSTGQQEKPGLNVKINTTIATRLQNLEVHSCRVKAHRNFKTKVEGDYSKTTVNRDS